MSILSGFIRVKSRRWIPGQGFKLLSRWTSANSVERTDGKNLQDTIGAIDGITDSLASVSSTHALSAKAGKELKDTIDGKNYDDRYYTKEQANYIVNTATPSWGAITNKPSTFPPSSHIHDDRYYTKTQINNSLGNYYTKSQVYTKDEVLDELTPVKNLASSSLSQYGGTMTGALNLYNSGWNKCGNDCYFGDNDVAGSFCLKGMNGATTLALFSNTNSQIYNRIIVDGSSYNTFITTNGNGVYISDGANTSRAPIHASAFSQDSSRRYKENVKNMTDDEGMQILNYRVVDYDYINKKQGTGCQGMIAEEVAEINKYPVTYNSDGEIDGLDYSKFVPQLIKMIQIQQKEIEKLKQKVGE